VAAGIESAQKRAAQVDGDNAVERFLGVVQKFGAVHDPGVADEDIDTAEALLCAGEHVLDRLTVRNVHPAGFQRAAFCTGEPSCLRSAGLVDIGQEHRCALSRIT
jgi:hypothetical protein